MRIRMRAFAARPTWLGRSCVAARGERQRPVAARRCAAGPKFHGLVRAALGLVILPFTTGPVHQQLHAQDGPLTLEQCVSVALEQNPLVLSAQQEYRASRARVSQAWALPQPSLNFDSDMQPSLTDIRGSQESYIGVGALIPFPAKTLLRTQIARKESHQVEADLALTELDLTYEVTAAFYALLLAREKAEYARQNLELSQNFVEQTELKFGAGDVPRVEVVRARVEAANAVSQLRRAEKDESQARALMNFLMARPGSSPLEVQGQLKAPQLDYEVNQLTTIALASRPEMVGMQSALEGASLSKKLGLMSYLPDFDVGAAQHRFAEEPNAWQLTLSVELPLFFWQPARGEIREAYAQSQALTQESIHLRNLISLEVADAHREYVTAASQIELMEDEILAQAEEVYEMYEFSYQQGEIGGIELIEAQRTLNEARQAYADSLFEYDIAIASLEKAVGRVLGDN